MNFGTEAELMAVLERVRASSQFLSQSEECLKCACEELEVLGRQERLSDMRIQVVQLQMMHKDMEKELKEMLDILQTPVIYGPPPEFR